MTTVDDRVAAALQESTGDADVRRAVPADAVGGVVPRVVVTPRSVEDVRDVVRTAGEDDLRIVVRGRGTKLGWGAPPTAVDVVLDTSGLDRILEHAAGDLVTRVEAGVPLAVLQEQLAPAGQQLALDPPHPGATVGGIVAANASGPRRLRYGTVRDLMIGTTVVLADGTVAKSGGKVVKNVAGYDLGKLFTGSLGTLGVITEAIFRLHPLPAARRCVHADVTTAAGAGQLVQAVTHSQLVPSAVELTWSPADDAGVLTILVEGIEPGVEAQAQAALALCRAGGATAARMTDTLPADWGVHPFDARAGDVGLKVAAVPAALPQVLVAIGTTAGRRGLVPRIRSSAATGVTYVGLSARVGAGTVGPVVADLRAAVAAYDGSVVVLDAPDDVKAALDVWGPVGNALGVMRRVKDRFDPQHRMSPGRFVGGI